MSQTADFISGTLTGSSRKYKYRCKVSGSSYYDQRTGKVITNISYSVQAINRTTGQECPLRPYTASSTKPIALTPDAPITEYNINIDTNNLVTINKV
jgi:hypothetical protein